MKRIKKYNFIIISILISIVGLVGFVVPYGEERWNFIFENLMWFPIELLITVLVLEKILDEKNKKNEMDRFIRVSGSVTMELISTIQHKLYSAFTAEMIIDEDKLSEKMGDIYENFESIYTIEHFKNGLDVYIVDTKKDIFKNSYKKNVSYQLSILKYSFEVNELIDNYIRKNEVFMPNDFYIELTKLRDVSQQSVIFRVDSNFQDKINLYSQSLSMDDESIVNVLFEMESVYKRTYDYIHRIKKFLEENAPS
ncbi:hypothetical protein ACFC9R_02535 [Enterococcus casseliflavus]|uniref:hypothetical protein n=1 Tax=Enterococcus gallinarum TaxID=1353 RepID=UPI001377C4AA|nr:hypothetical protein [Enterococcus gallinarum]NCE17248.1 hypothetical protein [Enterococcus gallinarum]